jgi:hypothetical protein
MLAIIVSVVPPAVYFSVTRERLAHSGSVAAGGGAGAALALDANADGNAVRTRLKAAHINFIDETTVYVLVNNFEDLEKLPLADYSQRILPGDPRDDGYARKLNTLFRHNGKRLIYIPASSFRALSLKPPREVLAAAVAGLSGVAIEMGRDDGALNGNTTAGLFAGALGMLALLAAFLAWYGKEPMLFGSMLMLAPGFLLLSQIGTGGFGLAAVVVALFQVARKGLLEWFVGRRRARFENALSQAKRPLHERRYWAIVFPLSGLGVAIAFVSGADAGILAIFVGTFVLSLVATTYAQSLSARVGGRAPFLFVPISPERYKVKYPALPIPFIAALVIATGLSAFGLTRDAGAAPAVDTALFSAAGGVTDDDYRAHYASQRDAAYRNLNENLPAENKYRLYRQGPNGLLLPAGQRTATVERRESGLGVPPRGVSQAARVAAALSLAETNAANNGLLTVLLNIAMLALTLAAYVPFIVERHRNPPLKPATTST